MLSLQGKINLFFQGYDDDNREVFQIPEIRMWAKKLIRSIDSLGFFLNVDDKSSGLRILYFCNSNNIIAKRVGMKYNLVIPHKETERFIYSIFDGLNNFCDRNNISNDTNKELSEKIVACLLG